MYPLFANNRERALATALFGADRDAVAGEPSLERALAGLPAPSESG